MTNLRLELELVFSVEPVIGWRIWRVARGVDRDVSALQLATELLDAERSGQERPVEAVFRHRLRSLSQPVAWPPARRFEATCGPEDVGEAHGAAPDASCECGVWAFRRRDSAEETLGRYAHSTGPLALGRVVLWGRIVEHESGWRAQYAYPVDLTIFKANAHIARELREAYACDVVSALELPGVEGGIPRKYAA